MRRSCRAAQAKLHFQQAQQTRRPHGGLANGIALMLASLAVQRQAESDFLHCCISYPLSIPRNAETSRERFAPSNIGGNPVMLRDTAMDAIPRVGVASIRSRHR